MTANPTPRSPASDPADPVDPAIERLATRRVAALRATIATRRMTPSMSVSPLDGLGAAEGDLAWWSGSPTRSEDPPPLDWPLRREIAMRLLSHAPGRTLLGVWTRPGPPEASDGDHEWAAALRHASAAYDGPPPPCVIVTRWGWLVLPEAVRRTWSTPSRPRSGRAGDPGRA